MITHHPSVVVHRQADTYGAETALGYRDYDTGEWLTVGWRDFSETVLSVADALLAIGVRAQENIGIFSQNKPECLYVSYAAYAIHAVNVPFYATSSAAQVRYMVNDAEIRYLFVGEQYQYDAAFRVFGFCHTLQQIVMFDNSICKDPRDLTSVYFDEFLRAGEDSAYRVRTLQCLQTSSEQETADILYTSGTTGEPKGVILTHGNYMEAFRNHEEVIPDLGHDDLSLSFLPLTHVFERAWTWFCLQRGAAVYLNLRPQDVATSLREVRPTAMCSVPRLWEKVYQGITDHMRHSTGLKQRMMMDALRVGHRYHVDYLRIGKTPPRGLALKYMFYERTVYDVVKRLTGVERGRIFPVAGAFVSPRVCEFMRSVGINFVVGYGLTESTATVSLFHRTGYVIGSVGEIQPKLEVRIGDRNEILLRGATITPGYYRKPEETRAAIDADGWFHTGDAGRIEGRTLFLTERIKDLFKTSNGKYISPQALESVFALDKYIDQVAIIAEGRKFVSALIVPVYAAVEAYANERGIVYADRTSLLAHPRIQSLFEARLDTLQQAFASYEQVKRFTLLPEPFSMERGELTNTLKLKRSTVAINYREAIERMYR